MPAASTNEAGTEVLRRVRPAADTCLRRVLDPEPARREVLWRVRGSAARPARRGDRERRAGLRAAARQSCCSLDLVGFTAASEARDAEDTRELLTRYFDVARTTVERYGGTVEKFIGDAVMAVWGAPVAREDDAERAVRAALELIGAVAPRSTPSLRARAGVLSGEAAVTIGAEGQGMVAGDLVNTASRIQSAADPGRCSSARRPSAHPRRRSRTTTRASTASRARASPSGSGAPCGSSPARADRCGRRPSKRRSSAVSASCGSSRTSSTRRPTNGALSSSSSTASRGSASHGWRGSSRSTSTGSHRTRGGTGAAVSPTATASPTGRWRRWCGCAAGSPRTRSPARRGRSSQLALSEYILDAEERAWVEPRARAPARARGRVRRRSRRTCSRPGASCSSDSPSSSPTVLVFEDIHWADWACSTSSSTCSTGRGRTRCSSSRSPAPSSPTSARAGAREAKLQRRSTLEPLPNEAMDDLLTGLVPGLPDDLRTRILERAEGDPALRGRDRAHAARPRAARPRGQRLPAHRRRRARSRSRRHCMRSSPPASTGSSRRSGALVQDAAVLGKTFTGRARGDHRGAEPDARTAARGLLRKEMLSVQADPLLAGARQYGFLQDLVKRVAYETLSRRERKAKHLAAADVPPRLRPATRTRSSRSSPPTTSTRLNAAPDAPDAGRDPAPGARDARPRRRPRSVARRPRRGEARLRRPQT